MLKLVCIGWYAVSYWGITGTCKAKSGILFCSGTQTGACTLSLYYLKINKLFNKIKFFELGNYNKRRSLK